MTAAQPSSQLPAPPPIQPNSLPTAPAAILPALLSTAQQAAAAANLLIHQQQQQQQMASDAGQQQANNGTPPHQPASVGLPTPLVTGIPPHHQQQQQQQQEMVSVPKDMLIKLVEQRLEAERNQLNQTPTKCQCRCQCGRYPNDMLIVDKVSKLHPLQIQTGFTHSSNCIFSSGDGRLVGRLVQASGRPVQHQLDATPLTAVPIRPFSTSIEWPATTQLWPIAGRRSSASDHRHCANSNPRSANGHDK